MGLSALLVFWGAGQAQTAELYLDGQNSGTAAVAPLAIAVLDIVGPASAPFALRLGLMPASILTQYGILGLDPGDPEAFNILDGFDPGHYNYGISSLPVSGLFTAFCVPFPTPEVPPGFTFHAQAYVNDPAAPAGATLTNVLPVECTNPPPVLVGGITNYTSASSYIYLQGSYFSGIAAENDVAIDGLPCTTIGSGFQFVNVLVPADAKSGPVRIATPWGISGGNPNMISTWCAVLTTFVQEAQAPAVITDRTTIEGRIGSAGERDQYVVHAEAGDEIFAEVYSWDTGSQLITEAINSVNSYFDPVVRIRRGGMTMVQDDDSGPQLNAAIGLTGGAAFFVADTTDDYVVEVDTYLSIGNGSYLIVLGRRTAQSLPVQVQGIFPNLARANDIVSVHATGVVPGNGAGHQVTIGGVVADVIQVVAGRIDVMVPVGARSGPVNLQTPSGATNHPIDRLQSWLCVVAPLDFETEGVQQYVTGGSSLIGSISPSTDIDIYRLQVQAGHQYRIEVNAWDGNQARITNATFLGQNPIDPDVRISNVSATLPYLAIDGNGGPGYNALIGNGMESPYFTAAVTGEYNVMVASWFGISQGAYVLNVVDVSP